MKIAKVLLLVLAAKNKHLNLSDNSCRVVVAWRGTPATFWALVPGHRNGVKRMQVSKSDAVFAKTPKNNNLLASYHCSV